MEKQIEKIMNLLDCSREDAISVIESDKRIDKGEKLFELSPEQNKASKKARQTTSAKQPTAYKFNTRERKADTAKRELIELLAECVGTVAEQTEVTNIEREINFIYNDKKYKIILSCPRK